MKSAYDLAVERLEGEEPTTKLSTSQKEQLETIDKDYEVKIADRMIFLNKQLQDAIARNDTPESEKIQKQISHEKIRLEEDKEKAKDAIRQNK